MRIKDMPRPGVELSRIVLVNWYGFSRLDIEIRGNVALIGRNGAGKSSLIDAIQLVLSGGNRRYFSPNASAEITSGAAKKEDRRSVIDYCVGKVENMVLRPETVSYVALVFRETAGDGVLTACMAMSARDGDADVVDLGSFIARDFDLTTDDFVQNGRTRPYADIENSIRKARGGTKAVFMRGKPGEFSSRLLRELTGNAHLEAETYLRALKNSLTFKAMDDPTDFVRRYVLPPPGLSSSKIEGLRRSYANWRSIEDRVGKAAVEVETITAIAESQSALLTRQREAKRWWMIEAVADRMAASEVEATSRRAADKAGRAEDAASARLARSREAIAQLDGMIALTKAELGEDRIREQVSQRRAEHKRASDEISDAQSRRARIVTALMGMTSLRPIMAEETGALDAAAALRAIDGFSKAAEKGDPIERALPPVTTAFEGMAARAEDAEGTVRDEMAALKAASVDDREALRRFQAGGALLTSRTSALVAELSAVGIKAEPLCSLVEVLDDRWRDAAETMLSNAREALIVPPSDVSRAIAVVDEAGDRFQGCLIYDAKERDRGSPSAQAGTLASKLRTDNPYARAFLDIRIGNIRCVEHRDDLRLHGRAVTPSVLVKSGGAIYKANRARNSLLGLTAQEGSAVLLQRRLEATATRMDALSVRASRLRRISAGSADVIRAIEAAADLGAIETGLVDAMNRAEASHHAAEALERSLTSDSFQTLRELEGDRSGHSEDMAQDELELKTAAAARGQATERLEGAASRLDAATERLRARTAVTPADLVDEASAVADKLIAARGGAQPVVKEARDAAEAAGARIEQRLQAVRQDAANYARDNGLEFDAGATVEDLAAWIERRQQELQGDVLAKYREQATTARAEMERSIYQDFILNLANDLELGRSRVRKLNAALREHSFNGERYTFTDAEHRDFADVVALSRAVMSSERKVSDLFDTSPERAEDLSDREARGMKRIRSIFEGGGDVDHFTDYRNYLTFDLVSSKSDTGARISGSKERGKRSGGERQVPFYIAMASAMASICYQGRKREMGFAMFDEAFSALDNANISSSLAMMQQLGLQVVLSAPTEKASAFVPHVDTVINVSRHEAFCQIDVEYPKDHAKDEMLARDPSISGIAALRR